MRVSAACARALAHTQTRIHICAFNHNLKTEIKRRTSRNIPEIYVCGCIVHLPQHRQNSKSVIFQEKLLKVLKCYNFLWVQQRHNCSPAVSFANCVMTLYLLKVHLQTFLSIPITQKCQILSCDTLVANEWYVLLALWFVVQSRNLCSCSVIMYNSTLPWLCVLLLNVMNES